MLSHFQTYNNSGLRSKLQLMDWENTSMHMQLASVEPNQPWSRNRLDDMESDLQDRFMCFEKHGGMNKREDRKRGLGS